MKILELRCKNLNSLYGEWHIDFSDPEYAYNGIFALTGPTGAGKSTILDAICLALYGSTPRLGRITQSNNDIMSRQTGECFAEVVFTSQAGTYRCTWSHHRSRKRADGEFQIPKHEISEAYGEKRVIEHQLKSVLIAVEEKTGMDFDRFTRSILLAQGDFDTFLKATVEQKSKILEQITGTGIYSEISIAVHERLRDERGALSILESETRGIPILSTEEESDLLSKLSTAEQEEKILETRVAEHTKATAWLTGIAQLEDDLKSLASEEQRLKEELLAFAPRRSTLDSATKAATLEGEYATLSEMRSQQKTEASLLSTHQASLPTLEAEVQTGSLALVEAETATQRAKTAQQEAAPTLKQVRLLDQRIAQHTSSISEGTHSIKKDVTALGTYKKEKEKGEEKIVAEQQKLSAIENYCTQHAPDRELVTELTGIVAQIEVLESKQEEIAKKEEEKKRATTSLEVAKKALDGSNKEVLLLQKQYDTTVAELQTKQHALAVLLSDKQLSEYRTEKEYLLREKEYLARIATLEEHRNHLKEGTACPLCGSLEHPFITGSVPVSDQVEEKILALTKLIQEAETLETTILLLVTKERDASTALSEQKHHAGTALHGYESAQSVYDSSTTALQEALDSYSRIQEVSMEKLRPYGVSEIPTDLHGLEASLRMRKEAWLEKEQERQTLTSSISSMKGEIQRLDGIIATYEESLKEKQVLLTTLGEAFAEVKIERHTLFEDKDPDREEEKLALAVQDSEVREKEANKASAALLLQLSTAKTKIETLQGSLASRKPILERKEVLFLESLSSIGFSDEQQFLSARLSLAERNTLTLEAKSLDERQTSLQTTKKDQTTRLNSEKAKHLTDKPLTELQPLFLAEEAELKKMRERVADYKATLKSNSEAKLAIANKQALIEKQRKEVTKWEKLHSLIGSADGKKFRTFAQGLTFELMVSHANKQLSKMSDRYLLIRSDEQPLELNVIDTYQAGEVRSTKNLSGGESFIVSMSLALGLSKMASQKVRVDSLFLDEGFGTLDEASLEIALKTLSNLQQDGKLIGVISHVSAMQDIISTQIRVTPTSGGRSTLSGPGCSKVEY